jgi:hypothetical protein
MSLSRKAGSYCPSPRPRNHLEMSNAMAKEVPYAPAPPPRRLSQLRRFENIMGEDNSTPAPPAVSGLPRPPASGMIGIG